MLHTLSLSLLPALMIVAAFTDVAAYKIPNWLTGLTAALFFPMAFLTGMPLADFGWHLLAGIVLFVVGYIGFSLRLFGGGDAKLLAAAGLWFGINQAGPFIVLSALAGGILAFCMSLWAAGMALHQHFGVGAEGPFLKKLRGFAPNLPYGIALCIGALLAFPGSWWVHGAAV
jgi:prepilin peptidase CpaA